MLNDVISASIRPCISHAPEQRMRMSSRVAHQRHSAMTSMIVASHKGQAASAWNGAQVGSDGSSPCEIKAFIQEEQPLNAAAPLVGSRSEAQAIPCHFAHLVPNMFTLHIWIHSVFETFVTPAVSLSNLKARQPM